MSEDLSARFAVLGTSTVSDALDKLGLPGAVPGILPLSDGFEVCGRAFTAAYEPVDERGGTVGDFLDDVADDQVVVIDNRGRTDCTVWGDIMTSLASRRGVRGTVINGVCRDVARSLELNYPVFSRGRSMQTGKDRVRLAAVNGIIQVGDTSVESGDYILGDADGVVVLSERIAVEVLDVAENIARTEERIRTAIVSGAPLHEAREQFGYHALQTPEVAR